MTFCRIYAILSTLTVLHAIAAENCLSCSQPREPKSPSFQVDLKANTHRGSHDSNIVLVDPLKPVKTQSGTCATQGKIRIRFDKRGGSKRTARIDLWFDRQVTGFSFDIGDSPTVNGWGGDSWTTSNAAEVHGKDRSLFIFSNVLPGYLDYTTDGHLMVENKAKALSDHVTYYISHERVEVTNYRGYQAVYDSKYLFVLDGGPIQHPRYPWAKPETDIWLSMNRVISGSYRAGTGLCKVFVSWV